MKGCKKAVCVSKFCLLFCLAALNQLTKNLACGWAKDQYSKEFCCALIHQNATHTASNISLSLSLKNEQWNQPSFPRTPYSFLIAVGRWGHSKTCRAHSSRTIWRARGSGIPLHACCFVYYWSHYSSGWRENGERLTEVDVSMDASRPVTYGNVQFYAIKFHARDYIPWVLHSNWRNVVSDVLQKWKTCMAFK